ncbi:MAG: DUF5666 domain-containing protein [Candidatus Binataceae bacterium]
MTCLALMVGIAISTVADSTAAAGGPITTIAGSMAVGQGSVVVRVGRSRMLAKTTSAGLFSMSSPRLAGTKTLIFKRGKQRFSMRVVAPAGTTVVLRDVVLASDGTAEAETEEVKIEGTLSAVSCDSTPQTFTVSNDVTSVTMAIDPATTELENEDTDSPIATCEDLAALIGSPAKAEGIVNPDSTITAEELEVGSGEDDGDVDDEDDGDVMDDAEFDGTIASTECPNSITVIRGDADVLVHITDMTKIIVESLGDDVAAACSDLTVGASVEVEGALQPDGSVNASKIKQEDEGGDDGGGGDDGDDGEVD